MNVALLLGAAGLAHANHPDDSCPDTHVDGPETMDGMVVNYLTWESYPNGAQLPLGTQLVASGHATAFGYCDRFIPNGTSCIANPPRLDRRVTIIGTWVRRRDATTDSESWGGIGGFKQDFDAYAEHKWANWKSSNIPAILTYRFLNGIDPTWCKVGEEELWGEPMTVYLMPDLRCPQGSGDGQSKVGNPCDAGTGNKSQVETDYDSPTTGLTLTRTYNSALPIDFGLGHGWITNFNKRLERFNTWLRVRRGNASGDIFTSSGGAWTGPPDSDYALSQDGTGYTITRRDGGIERYALNGSLAYETDAVGRTTHYTYDTNGRLLAVTGPFGHTLSFTYNSAGRLAMVIDPALQTITYSYDANDNLATVTHPGSTVRTYHYELTPYQTHALTGITDENGDRYATFGYHSTSGKAILTQHAQTTNGQPQEKYSLAYPSATQTTVTDPAGNNEVLTFLNQHGARLLTSRISQVDSKGITQTFDANNNLLSRTDAEGRITQYTYNGTNQRITMTEAFGTPQARTTSYQYLSANLDLITHTIAPSVASGQQRQLVTSYNPNRTVSAVSEQGFKPDGTPLTRTTSFLYNSQGQVTQINGPRTDVADTTLFEYYECTTGGECGQLKKITNALGHETLFDFYDAHSRLTQETDPNGLLTSYTYDLRGRVTSSTAGARVTLFTYDDAGQLQTATTPEGRTLTYTYDAAHDLRSITDNFGNTISYTYDLKGNRKTDETRDPSSVLKKSVSYTYDLRNRLDTINAAGSLTDLLFDKVGNLKQEVDPNTHTTAHTYDPLDRLKQTTDALSGIMSYSYDVTDSLTQVQAANGATTTYSYDDLGNLLQQSSPDTGTTSYTYDAAGNRLSSTDARGVLTTYSYDALNRPLSVSYPTGSLNRTFTYDAGLTQKGRLTGSASAGGSATLSYNLFGELLGDSRTVAGQSFSTGYTYDAGGRVATITYPSSGRLVTYTRNTLGQVTQVSTTLGGITTVLASQVQYLPFGPIRELTLGNGIVSSRSRDQQYRLSALLDSGSGTVRDRSYTYDAAGNIDQIQDNLTSVATQNFAQDVLHRLTSDSSSYGAVTYLYDAVGNRTRRQRGATIEQTITYTANSNRLNQLNAVAFSYDAAGNTLADGPGNRAYTYDDTSRLTEVRVSGVLQATSLYNANGQRVRKIEATGAQRTFFYHYGPRRELLGETVYNSANQKIAEREYLWLDSEPLAFTERTFDAVSGAVLATQLAYLHPDHLGTPRLATDPTQRVVWRWTSDAFGAGAAENDPDADTVETPVALRLPGQYFDAETGLNYNYFRDYDSNIGRYLESDPIGLAGGINTYAYVGSNPVTGIDPLGLESEDFGPWDPGALPEDPTPKGRDRRTPWLPENLQKPRKNCPRYYGVTVEEAGRSAKGFIPLVKEKILKETKCERLVRCIYRGVISPLRNWENGTVEGKKVEYTVEIRIKKDEGCCEK